MEKKIWIDHVYVSNKFLQDGIITGAGIDTGKITCKSDHIIVGVRINFTTMVELEECPKHRKIDPQRSNKQPPPPKEAYRTIAQTREEKRNRNKKRKTDSSTGTPNSTR